MNERKQPPVSAVVEPQIADRHMLWSTKTRGDASNLYKIFGERCCFVKHILFIDGFSFLRCRGNKSPENRFRTKPLFKMKTPFDQKQQIIVIVEKNSSTNPARNFLIVAFDGRSANSSKVVIYFQLL